MTYGPPVADPRSPGLRAADEAAAAGDWTGFETHVLLTEDAALQLLDECRGRRDECERDPNRLLGGARGQLFRWNTQVYRISGCSWQQGALSVEVSPQDAAFAEEVQRRMEANRFHHLDYCQCFGFVCFPEDYSKFKG